MMKKNRNRIFALALVCALLLSFASCTKKTADAPNTTGDAVTQGVTEDGSQPQDSAEPETGSTPAQSPSAPVADPSGAAGKGGSTTTAKGTQTLSKAQIIALYNQSVRVGAPKRTSLTRSMQKGALWAPGKFDGASFDLVKEEKSLKAFNLTDNSAASCDLPQLQESWVESAALKTSGGKRILTIKLKTFTGGNSIQNGAGGYVNLVTFEQGKTLAKAIGKSLGSTFGAISVKTINSTLSGGILTATLPADSDRVQSVSFTYNQRLEMGMKLAIVEVKGDITAKFQMNYGA